MDVTTVPMGREVREQTCQVFHKIIFRVNLHMSVSGHVSREMRERVGVCWLMH